MLVRAVIIIVCVAGLFNVLGIDSSILLSYALFVLILSCAFHYIFKGSSLNHFWLLVIILLIGPCLITVLLSRFLASLSQSSFGSNLWLLLLVIALMVLSALYVRHRWSTKTTAEMRATHERQPVSPHHKQDLDTDSTDDSCLE